jgi:hypothetical protein
MGVFSKTTLGKIAACQAVGLHYWSDHPAANCVWAVDDEQQPHVVRWYRKTNEAAVQHVGDPRKETWWDKNQNRRLRDVYSTADVSDRVKVA